MADIDLTDSPDRDFCHQCFGRGWVWLNQRRVVCANAKMHLPEASAARQSRSGAPVASHGALRAS